MFEQGVIRPPSEADSLLVRVTRNCPWNRCQICPAYKGKKFSKRTVDEVKRDIDMMAQAYSSKAGSFTSAFLQDADSLILPAEELTEIITHIRKTFKNINRITTYARAKSMKRKSSQDYLMLREAGLNRIHTGMESGSLKVLKLIQKGIKPEDILQGGGKVVESGISLSVYVMPGVGGKDLSNEHVTETARILNQIKPDFIRVRTFAIPPQSPIQRMVYQGLFDPMKEEETVAEIRLLLKSLDEMPTHFRCGDFSLNLLMQVDGRLDTHKEAMIQILDEYLSLSKDQKQAYSLLRRSYPGRIPLDVIKDKGLIERLKNEIETLEEKVGFEEHIRMLMSYQLPQLQTEHWN